MFAPFDPIVANSTRFVPAARLTVTLTVFHVAHDPVGPNDRLALTVAPLTFRASGRSAAVPLA